MITLVFAQFGKRADNLNPSLDSFKKHFPDSKCVLYSDVDVKIEGVETKVVNPPYDKNHKRYGHRCNDLYKAVGLLEASTEYAIALDSDMLIVSDQVKTLLPLTKGFDLCLPVNPRFMVKVDSGCGEDSDKKLDETEGSGLITNMSPISFYTSSSKFQVLLAFYKSEMLNNVVRGPIAMWRAIWRKQLFPCILPPQWCVCAEHCGVGNEIILHYGHHQVRRHYKV